MEIPLVDDNLVINIGRPYRSVVAVYHGLEALSVLRNVEDSSHPPEGNLSLPDLIWRLSLCLYA